MAKTRQTKSRPSADKTDAVNAEQTILRALSTAAAIVGKQCRAEGLHPNAWRDFSRLAKSELGPQAVLAKSAIERVSEKGQRALRAQGAIHRIAAVRSKAKRNERVSAAELDDALFSMLITTNYLLTMGQDGVGHTELLARGDSSLEGSSAGGSRTPADSWRIPAKEIFETLWAAGERHKTDVAWAARIRKEAETLQVGSTANWTNGLLKTVGDFKETKGIMRPKRNKRTSAS